MPSADAAGAERPVPMVVGPTASGKTARAIALAHALGGEVVSADSRQVYAGLEIGAATPTLEEREGVPHHFLGELPLGTPFSAGAFARAAEARIAEVHARGRVAIVAGGSTLYLAALRDGLADLPAVPTEVRDRLAARLVNEGLPALVADIDRVDPALAARLDRKNPARVLRALEVVEATGTPLSVWQAAPPPPPRFRYAVEYLRPDRPALHARIDRRVAAMFAAGLVDEVRGLLAAGHSAALAPLRTIGYREVIAHLAEGRSLDETAEAIRQNTRRYARRQTTYFDKFCGLQ